MSKYSHEAEFERMSDEELIKAIEARARSRTNNAERQTRYKARLITTRTDEG